MLEARYKDPDFGKIFIPMLENELIDSNRSTFFLEKLEDLFRKEAYQRHLEKRIDHQKRQQEGKERGEEGRGEELHHMDYDTLRRRKIIRDLIKERQRDQKVEGKGNSANYKGVVKETELFDIDDNEYLAALGRVFQTGRKLKPLVRAK